MQKNNLAPNTPNKKAKLVGRGGTRGKTSGRGTKGQSARSNTKKRPQIRDIIKKLPKLRGYKFNASDAKPTVVTLAMIDKKVKGGEILTAAQMVALGIINSSSGKSPKVKVLSKGTLTKKVTIKNCDVSATARVAIEKAGGKII